MEISIRPTSKCWVVQEGDGIYRNFITEAQAISYALDSCFNQDLKIIVRDNSGKITSEFIVPMETDNSKENQPEF